MDVSTQCDGGIGFHVKALVRLGATKQEVKRRLQFDEQKWYLAVRRVALIYRAPFTLSLQSF
ncbi:hypothetical protein [Alteromonas oceanisediminis]|uniref:hypothetical protein n=1 Tax=Alteromonas oceanisediminis TaxID=2836180 RepID=UPI002023B607|nr:hypothetical protein [Alteromonas oceanisediminis]